jgi:VWFA-related protein
MKDATAPFIPGSFESHVEGVKRMKRRRTHILWIAVVTAALPLLSTAQEQRSSQQPIEEPQVFRAGAELVVLHVNVFDGRSDAVPNLPQNAFTVYEDGKPQDISFFEAGDVPVTVGLVIDNSTSMLTERDLVVAGTKTFAESSHPEDQMFAVVFNEHVRLGLPSSVEFTTNRLQLIGSLARYAPGGKTALYDAVIAGLDQLEKGAYQKHVLVVLSDGGDNASEHSEKEMLRRVEASSALIYTIVDPDVFTPGEGNRGVLRRLAKLSGGLAYFPKSEREVVENFTEIAGNIRRGYSIGYAPGTTSSHEHDRPHRLKVTVRMPGRSDLSVRVRNGYAESDSPGTR